jgi:hypothetical protein
VRKQDPESVRDPDRSSAVLGQDVTGFVNGGIEWQPSIPVATTQREEPERDDLLDIFDGLKPEVEGPPPRKTSTKAGKDAKLGKVPRVANIKVPRVHPTMESGDDDEEVGSQHSRPSGYERELLKQIDDLRAQQDALRSGGGGSSGRHQLDPALAEVLRDCDMLRDYAPMFKRERVRLDDLLQLSLRDMQEVVPQMGPRLRLLQRLRAIGQAKLKRDRAPQGTRRKERPARKSFQPHGGQLYVPSYAAFSKEKDIDDPDNPDESMTSETVVSSRPRPLRLSALKARRHGRKDGVEDQWETEYRQSSSPPSAAITTASNHHHHHHYNQQPSPPPATTTTPRNHHHHHVSQTALPYKQQQKMEKQHSQEQDKHQQQREHQQRSQHRRERRESSAESTGTRSEWRRRQSVDRSDSRRSSLSLDHDDDARLIGKSRPKQRTPGPAPPCDWCMYTRSSKVSSSFKHWELKQGGHCTCGDSRQTKGRSKGASPRLHSAKSVSERRFGVPFVSLEQTARSEWWQSGPLQNFSRDEEDRLSRAIELQHLRRDGAS